MELSIPESDLAEKIIRGDRRNLARFISRVECGDHDAETILSRLYPHVGRAYRVGITGPPGAGKSTLTNKLTMRFRRTGKKVAVIAVDPTSPFTGGALLGDRIRMNEIALDEGIFIRSMATRGSLGGLSQKAVEVADVLDAAGFDIVILETVGVGQSELDIVGAADTTVVVLVPESGDVVQAMKAGLMEIADIFVINKADHAGSDKAVQALETSLQLRDHTAESWLPRIVKTVSIEGKGIDQLREQIEVHRAYLETNGGLQKKRRQRETEFIKKIIAEKWQRAFWTEAREHELNRLAALPHSPYHVAEQLLNFADPAHRL